MTQWKFETTADEVVQTFAKRVKGKTIVITGPGQGGLGSETAISLARASPALLVLAGRTESKITPVIAQIHEINPNLKAKFVQLDLGSQKSVHSAATEISAAVEKIDILINNAGIMACPYAKSEEGIEIQFATNHIGHFLLTKLLIDKIYAAGPGARIVNVSSSALRGSIRFDDYNFQDGAVYESWDAYGQSKISNVVFSRALARKLKNRGIFSYSLHPGSISSGLQVYAFASGKSRDELIAEAKAAAVRDGRTLVVDPLKTLQQGSATIVVAALDPSIEPESGAYLRDGDVYSEQSFTSEEDQEKLWSLSERLTGGKFDV